MKSTWVQVILGLFLILVFGSGSLLNASARDAKAPEDEQPGERIFLPVVRNNYPLPMSVFGVEVTPGWIARTSEKAQQARVTWVRYNGIAWHEVEAQRGIIDWSVLSSFENEMIRLNQAGISPMVIVRGVPEWAQIPDSQYVGYTCGPIDSAALGDFANFLNAVVSRYSKPPFNVHYWELGNEPDVDPDYVYADPPYGCWGDDADPYYGAARYSQMLSVAYPAIKGADPSAQVILGGLLLDCDPTNPPENYNCTPGNFLEGVLRSGGGQYLDVIAYHSYPYWYGADSFDWDLNYQKWKDRGGILLGKADFIREVMARYGVQKPILMNEGGLMCGFPSTHPRYPECQETAFNGLQANHLIRLYTRSWAVGLEGVAWYTLNGPGWREGGLLNSDASARLSYQTLEFLSNLLLEARFSHQLASGTLEGYEFVSLERSGPRYQIYWSNDLSTFPVDLPAGTSAVYDRYGGLVAYGGNQLQVGFDPVVIVFEP
ncbi:MAG: hypothetical protein JW862_08765 [Anaerolineales bacterium]|nr:hypothetical protein [Anaerolineales bacterium]